MNQPIQSLTALVDSGNKTPSFLEDCIDFFPAMIYVYDLDKGEVSGMNNKVSEYLGFSIQEFETLHSDLVSIVHEEDALIFVEVINFYRTLGDRQSHTFTIRFNHKDGGCKHLKTTGTVVRTDATGKAQAILCIAQNITDQVKFEDEATTARQLLDETEKLLLFGTWSWSPKADKIEWTDGMYGLLEYSEEKPEVNNVFFSDHILPEHADNVRKAVNDALKENTGFEIEYVLRTRTGKEKYVYTKGKPLLDKDGNLKKVVGITRDITSKKNFENERDRNIRELNRSNKELEEFAYVASHDMHEPLRKVLTFSERIRSKYAEALGDEGRVYLERISASAGNMRNLIDNLLEFSKISRGTRSFISCDLKDVIGDVLSDQELRIEETSTKISLGNLPVVEAVPSELRQLFNNLISNALKFRRKDTDPVIEISSHVLNHKEKADLLLPFNQLFYQIDVADNGIGFESAYNEKIFEIFQRLHGKTEYSGSGIGLAICKKIVENHDGIIYATSNPGIGSSFCVILPEKQYT